MRDLYCVYLYDKSKNNTFCRFQSQKRIFTHWPFIFRYICPGHKVSTLPGTIGARLIKYDSMFTVCVMIMKTSKFTTRSFGQFSLERSLHDVPSSCAAPQQDAQVWRYLSTGAHQWGSRPRFGLKKKFGKDFGQYSRVSVVRRSYNVVVQVVDVSSSQCVHKLLF